VGGHQPLRADVRVIAATHQNLEERVKQGLFREDLYHRLNVIRLRLPALRERREDIPLLARHFLARSARELGVEPKRLSPEAAERIAQLPFPGNVRQLENLCHWLTVLAPAQLVQVSDLPDELRQAGGAPLVSTAPALPPASSEALPPAAAPAPAAASTRWTELLAADVERLMQQGTQAVIDELTRDFESTVIRTALKLTQGRRIEAAARLGLGRNTITRKIQSLGLDS
jgi:two-component system nitrogen regulation response regulator GlnG